ncbi:MAG: hypothetical protein EOM64_10755 [Erysipelotrichia bacterium]|nr:hypothetical protein [Erysipelotrichia bacterium]
MSDASFLGVRSSVHPGNISHLFEHSDKIYVTTPMSIKSTIDDLSLNALVLQILADPKHEAALIKAIQSRKSKLQPEDVEALLTGEYQIIDR